MDRATIILNSAKSRKRAAHWCMGLPCSTVATFTKAKRTTPQNAKMWAMLTDIAQAKPEGRDMKAEQWKGAFMSACGHEVKWINGIDGHPPFPDHQSSSRLTKEQMADLITFIAEYGDRHGVKWSDTE